MTFKPPLTEIMLAMQTAGRLGAEFYQDFSASDAKAILARQANLRLNKSLP